MAYWSNKKATFCLGLFGDDWDDYEPRPPALGRAPKPSLRTRLRDLLGFPRPEDEPEGFEW